MTIVYQKEPMQTMTLHDSPDLYILLNNGRVITLQIDDNGIEALTIKNGVIFDNIFKNNCPGIRLTYY